MGKGGKGSGHRAGVTLSALQSYRQGLLGSRVAGLQRWGGRPVHTALGHRLQGSAQGTARTRLTPSTTKAGGGELAGGVAGSW